MQGLKVDHLQSVDGPDARPAPMQRAFGRAEVTFRLDDGLTRLDRLYQEGQAKIRLPKTHGDQPVAVFLNTAGGVTGGDLLQSRVDWGAGTRATATSQAAERIYRASDQAAGVIETQLVLGADAKAEWLPQETILFDRSRLLRRISVDLAENAALLMVETTVFGRSAMGETVRQCALADHWRVRRNGKLIYADSFKVGSSRPEMNGYGDAVEIMAGTATGAGATAMATILLAAPDAEMRLSDLRDIFETVSSEAGASSWNGLLVARMISTSARDLRGDLVHVLQEFRGRDLPRPWYI